MHHNLHIYVAHGDPWLRRVLVSICRMTQGTVRGMEDYARLREYLALWTPALVVVADDLPGVAIGPLLDEVQQTEFMVVTANEDFRYRRDLQFMGACRVITAPLDVDGMVRDIAMYLET